MSTIEEVREQARKALTDIWDDGNATGLDGWVGPGRGAGDVDDEAIRARERAIEKHGRALLDATEPPVPSEPSGYRAILIQKARAHADEYRCYDDTDELVGTLVESANMLAADAPVQASTIVDEEALAGEISRHKLVHVSVSRKSAFCMCSSSVRSGTDDNLAWFDKHRAHALAEWLKEQGR